MSTVRQILKEHRLRHTGPREDILSLFLARTHALTHADIEQAIGEVDRVTVYRTLRTFIDKGVLHKIPDDSGAPRYALCPEACPAHAHQHDHVHFKCNVCGQTSCLEAVQVPTIPLPPGFRAEEHNVLVRGVGPCCRQRNIS